MGRNREVLHAKIWYHIITFGKAGSDRIYGYIIEECTRAGNPNEQWHISVLSHTYRVT